MKKLIVLAILIPFLFVSSVTSAENVERSKYEVYPSPVTAYPGSLGQLISDYVNVFGQYYNVVFQLYFENGKVILRNAQGGPVSPLAPVFTDSSFDGQRLILDNLSNYQILYVIEDGQVVWRHEMTPATSADTIVMEATLADAVFQLTNPNTLEFELIDFDTTAHYCETFITHERQTCTP